MRPLLVSLLLVAAPAAGAQQQPAAPAQPPPAAPQAPAPAAADLRPAAPSGKVLSLDEAERTARERQPQLAQARSNVEAASARVEEARAPLLPQVGGSASYERSTTNAVTRPGSTVVAGTPVSTGTSGTSWATTGFWSFGVSASQLLWDFGQTTGRWRSAQALESAQRSTERASQSQVLLTVRTAFFQARAQRDLVRVASETLANQEAHLRQVEGFVRAGTRPEIDLLQARTDRANAQVQLIVAENNYALGRAQLNQAMGVTGSTDYQVASDTLPPIDVEDATVDALVPEAERNRPDLVALEQQARAQELNVSAVQGGYWPAVGVSTGVVDQGPTLGSTVWNWNATATLSWNLFQGGLTRAQVREARANESAARSQAEILRQQIRVDLDQARLAVRAAKGSLGAANEAFANAKERLRQAERRYQLGVGSLIDVSDAQLAATNAAAQLVQAEFILSTSRAQLVRALGREVQRG